MHFTLSDLLLFGVDDAGVRWRTNPDRCRGWWGGPASTIQVVQNTRRHGGNAGEAYYAADHLKLGGTVLAPDAARLEDAADALRAACTLAETVLLVDGARGLRWARVRREGMVTFEPTSDISADWSVGLVLVDPRRFGVEESATAGLPSTVGGLRWPVRWPLRWPAATVSGQVSMTNPGKVTGPVRLRIDGPVTGPIVTHVSTGARLVFATSVVLGAGEFLTVDMETQEVLAQGEQTRAGWVTEPGFSGFEPGDNTWSFTAAAHNPGALLTVYATPAW